MTTDLTNGTLATALNDERSRAEMAKLKVGRMKDELLASRLEGFASRFGGGRAMASGGGWDSGYGYSSGWGGGFDSAKPSRLKSSWSHRGGSADSWRAAPTLDVMRAQAQDALRNDPLVQALVGRLQDHVVGDEIRFQVRSGSAEFNNAVEKWAERWMAGAIDDAGYVRADGCSSGRGVVQLCRLAEQAFETDGDALVILKDAGTVQMVEAQRVRNPGAFGTIGINTPGLVNGVRFVDGRVAAYSIAEWETVTGGAYPSYTCTEVPAEFVLHLRGPWTDNINQTRPEPGLQALLETFGLLREYQLDTAAAAKIALLFGLITKTEYPQDFSAQIPGVRDVDDVNGDGTTYQRAEIELQPGFTAHLKAGESIEQVKPEHPTTVFGDYIKSVATMLGAAKGLPLVLWLLDFSGVNFSSAKSAIQLAYTGIKIRRASLVRQFLVPLMRWRVALALRRGEIEGASIDDVPEGWDDFAFYFPTAPVLEPEKQYDASAKGINARLLLPRDEVKRYSGMEFEEFVAKFAEDQAMLEAAGIAMVQAPGVMKAGAEEAGGEQAGEQGSGGAGEREEDEEEDEDVGVSG